MKIKQTLTNLIGSGLIAVSLMFTGAVLTPAFSVSAADCDPQTQSCCGGVETSIFVCEQDGTGTSIENTGVWGILLVGLNIMAAGVGVAALGGIVYGAILYISAGGSPDQVKKAIEVFTNVVIGIIAFAGMYALLNFLVPGGLFT